ncbi:MAG TPA: BamA/TamA family outer membrane protein [Sphingomonadaceae bacterium]|nr:BamA/TamA family outer membrane protein [Sphingomonadaceae bacterium]
MVLLGIGLGVASPALAQDTAPDAALENPAFEASLPPLDQTEPPSSALTPAPAPARSPGEPPADAERTDPELTAPLPPIATFDATPPASAAVTDEELPRIRYDVAIEGLKAIGLDGQFRDLSALLHDGRDAANAAQVSARAEEDVALAERLLRSEGYYDGVATFALAPPDDAGGPLRVTLTATPGPRYVLGAIEVTKAAPEPRALALEALGLEAGEPIVAARIEGAEARVSLRLPEQGYPFVELGARDVVLDERDHHGDYSLPVDSGPRSRFGGIRTAGREVFGPEHIEVLTRFKRGDLYDSRQVDDLRQALIATSLLSSVAIRPVRTGETAADGTEVVDLMVRQVKGPARQLAGSIGYGTGEGIKVTGAWTHRNLFPPEGALSVNAIAGTQKQGLGATFQRSNAGQRDRVFSLGASVARENFDAYNAQTISLTGSLSRQSTPIFQKRWTWSVGGELIATREKGFEGAAEPRARSTYLIAALPLQLGYDRSNSLLDPTTGFRLTARVSPEVQKRTSGGFEQYARLLAEGSAYYPVSDALVMAGRVRVGSIVGAPRDDIAPSRRLYAGGGGSVRGFGYQELGPKDANGDPVGGRSLTEFAVEARYRFGNFGIVPFLDGGRVGVGSTPSIGGMRYGVGIGARYYTNFGPFRIDVATPINRQPGESRVALYISIGQAF